MSLSFINGSLFVPYCSDQKQVKENNIKSKMSIRDLFCVSVHRKKNRQGRHDGEFDV